MKILSLDSETYFDDEYSLKRMSTEAYVRDLRFSMHCWGCYDPASGAMFETDPTAQQLDACAVLHHHAHFDGLILAHHYGIRPAFCCDTLSMARCVFPRARSHSLEALAARFDLPQKTVPYHEFKGQRFLDSALKSRLVAGACHDAWLTWQIFLRLVPHVPKEQLRVFDSLIRMFTEPVLHLNARRCAEFVADERQRKADLLTRASVLEGQMQSAEQFRTALEAIGYECPMKWRAPTKTHPEGRYIPAIAKTDEAMTELLEHEDERVQALAMARLGVKSTLGETRGMALLHTWGRGPLPVYQKAWGAHTGRTSAGDGLNTSNLPRLDKPGGALRLAIEAPPGCKLVIGDSAQIQLRINAALAGETWVLDALKGGRDIYAEIATDFYGRPVDKSMVTERTVGKQIELGCGFGMGGRTKPDGKPSRFREFMRAQGILLSDAEALHAVEGVYRARHPNIVKFWNICGDRVLPMLLDGANVPWRQGPVLFRIKDHKIWLPNDTALDYTGIYVDDTGAWRLPSRKGDIYLHGPKICENVVQALEVIIIWQAHLRIMDRTPYAKLCLTSYDELVYCVPDEFALDTTWIVEQELSREPAWFPGIPLKTEVHISGIYDK